MTGMFWSSVSGRSSAKASWYFLSLVKRSGTACRQTAIKMTSSSAHYNQALSLWLVFWYHCLPRDSLVVSTPGLKECLRHSRASTLHCASFHQKSPFLPGGESSGTGWDCPRGARKAGLTMSLCLSHRERGRSLKQYLSICSNEMWFKSGSLMPPLAVREPGDCLQKADGGLESG